MGIISHIMKYLLVLIILTGFTFETSYSQKKSKDFTADFSYGKSLLSQSKFTQAKEVFKDIAATSINNPYFEYSAYYFSYSAFQINDLLSAKGMLNLLINKSPEWDKIDEARSLLSEIHFKEQNYTLAIQEINKIQDRNIKVNANTALEFYLGNYTLDQHLTLYKDFKDNIVVEKTLIPKLSSSKQGSSEYNLLKELEAKYKITSKNEVKANQKPTQLKDSYNVAILFPFEYEQINTSSLFRKSQYLLDLYQGILIGSEELSKKGINLKLFSFDTENSVDKTKKILEDPGFKNMDIIFGPLFDSTTSVVLDFSKQTGIPVVNPLSSNGNIFSMFEKYFLFNNSLATSGIKTADFMVDSLKSRNAFIFYQDTPQDSILAANYKKQIESRSGKIEAFYKMSNLDKNTYKNILSHLQPAKSVANSHLFVACSDEVFAINIQSAIQTYKLVSRLVVTKDWLNFPLANYEQYETSKIMFIYPFFMQENRGNILNFKKMYYEKNNVLPSRFSFIGYEMINYFGTALSIYGTEFPSKISEFSNYKPQYFTKLDYKDSRDNQHVPIVTFVNGVLEVLNK